MEKEAVEAPEAIQGLPSAAPALTRGLAIVEVLDCHPEGLTLTELSARIDTPKNSTLRFIQALVEQGWAVRDPVTLRVSLTAKVLRLGQPRRGDVSLSECALPVMRELRDDTGETAQLGVLSGEEVVLIEKQESRLPVRIGVEVGMRLLLHDNAPGKVLVAFQPELERERLIARMTFSATTPFTITDRGQFRRACLKVVEQGYAVDLDEAYEGIRCVGAPIFDRTGHILACLWISGPAVRLPEKGLAQVAPRVISAAERISAQMRQ